MLADEIEQTLDELKRVYRLNVELLENLDATVMWFAQYSEKTGAAIPNAETLWRLMREAVRLGEEIGFPPAPQHSFIKPLRRTEDRSPRDIATECPRGGFLLFGTISLHDSVYQPLERTEPKPTTAPDPPSTRPQVVVSVL